jgi:hypothetical protein
MDRHWEVFAAVAGIFFFVSAAMAQGRVTVDSNPTNASNNPLTPKVTLYTQNFFAPLVLGQDGRTSNEGLVRLYVPFDLGGVQNSLRIYAPIDTVPAETTSRRGSLRRTNPAEALAGALGAGTDFGFGDVMAFDLVMKQIGNFGFGIGPLVVFPTASHEDLGTGTWQAGPAAIAVRRWDWGLTGVTVTYSHSFAGPGPSVQALGVEPLILYNLDNGYYLRSTAFWNIGFGTEPSYIPIGFGIGKVWKLPDGTTVNLHIEPQYSVYAQGVGAPRWQILAGLITQF